MCVGALVGRWEGKRWETLGKLGDNVRWERWRWESCALGTLALGSLIFPTRWERWALGCPISQRVGVGKNRCVGQRSQH